MQNKTIHKILTDEDTLDIAQAAEASLQNSIRKEKKKKPQTREKAFSHYMEHKYREQQQEALRQSLAKVWNKPKT